MQKEAIFDANVNAKVEENTASIVGTKHDTNYGRTKVDARIGAKKNVKRDTKVDINMGATLDEKVDAIEVDAKVDAK